MRMQEQSDDARSTSFFRKEARSLAAAGTVGRNTHYACDVLVFGLQNGSCMPCSSPPLSHAFFTAVLPPTSQYRHLDFQITPARAHEMDPNNVVNSEIDAKYSSLGSRPNTMTAPVDASVPYRDTEREDETAANKNMQAGTEEENENAGKAAVIIQKHYRGHVARKHVQELRLSVTSYSICRKCHESHIQESF